MFCFVFLSFCFSFFFTVFEKILYFCFAFCPFLKKNFFFSKQRLRLRVLYITKEGDCFSEFQNRRWDFSNSPRGDCVKSVARICPLGFCHPWVSACPSSKSVARPPLPLRRQNRHRHRRHNCRRQRLWRQDRKAGGVDR